MNNETLKLKNTMEEDKESLIIKCLVALILIYLTIKITGTVLIEIQKL